MPSGIARRCCTLTSEFGVRSQQCRIERMQSHLGASRALRKDSRVCSESLHFASTSAYFSYGFVRLTTTGYGRLSVEVVASQA